MVPLQLLIGMFSDGVNSLKELANQRKARASDLSGNARGRRVSASAVPRRRRRRRRAYDTPLTYGLFPRR